MKRRMKSALSLLLAAAIAVPAFAVPTASGAEEVQKYEFEDGTVSGGKIHTEGWKGNTAEDGTGEDYDMTEFSGDGFTYLEQKGTSISVDVTVPADGL